MFPAPLPAPANTLGYMIAGYTLIFSVLLGYILSLALRLRRLERQRKDLEE